MGEKLKKYKNIVFMGLLLGELLFLVIGMLWALHGVESCIYSGTDPYGFLQTVLKKGTYRIEVQYKCDQDAVTGVVISETDPTAIKTDHIYFYTWRNQETQKLWVTREVQDAQYLDESQGHVQYQDVKIYATADDRRMAIAILFCLFVLLDLLLCWYDRVYCPSDDRRGCLIRTVLMVVAALLPGALLTRGYLFHDHDVVFHLYRMEGIYEGWRSGEFPVRIYPNMLDGAGYEAPVFYADLFLIPGALARVMGFSVQTSYMFAVLFMWILSAVVAWFSFGALTKHKWLSIAQVYLYQFGAYHLNNIYRRAAVGEFCAMAFLPLIFCGFLLLLRGGRAERSEKDQGIHKGMWMLGLGYAGVLYCHNLSVLLTTLFLVVLAVVFWRSTFRKKVMGGILGAAGIALVLSLGYLLPFMDAMLQGGVGITEQDRESALEVSDVFLKWLMDWKCLFAFGEYGAESTALYGAGFVICLLLGILALILGRGKVQGDKRKELAGVLFFGCFTLWICTKWCPWGMLTSGGVLVRLAWLIQFPFRLIGVAMLMAIITAGLALDHLAEILRERLVFFGAVLLGALTMLSGCLVMKYYDEDLSCFWLYDKGAFSVYVPYGFQDSFFVSDSFYFPVGINYDAYKGLFERTVGEGSKELNPGVDIQGAWRRGSHLEADVENLRQEETSLLIPFVYYSNYHAWDMETGEEFPVEKGSYAAVQVRVPAGYSGHLKVEYQSPWYWTLAWVISLGAALGVPVLLWKEQKSNAKKQEVTDERREENI